MIIVHRILSKSFRIANLAFSLMLFGLKLILLMKQKTDPNLKKMVNEKNFIAQIKIQDNSAGRYFCFENGEVSSKKGLHKKTRY